LAFNTEKYAAVDDALRKVTDKILQRHQPEVVSTKKAYGRISAGDVASPTALPPFATSHMDGFAVISKDLQNAMIPSPIFLRLAGEMKLGSQNRRAIHHGEAIRVATGSRIPSGADTVLPSETVKQRGGRIAVSFEPERGSFVYNRGRDIRRGDVVLTKGQVIRAQQIGLLLGIGIARVRVWRRPRVSVMATGNELTNAAAPKPGRIRNSHSPFFLALIGALGCVPIDMGIVKDELPDVAQAIRESLARSDLVITLGGTSVGKKDVVVGAVSSLAPEVILHGIRMDRGRVTGIAVVGGKPVLMMPGPIQGAMNAFVLFGVQLVNLLSGSKGSGLEIPCRMGKGWEARKSFAHYTKVMYVKLDSQYRTTAEPIVGETESIKVLSDADGYVVVPEGVTRLRRGDVINVRLMPGFSFT
jgi:molybdenum cofactor synthesis domain-containing protein